MKKIGVNKNKVMIFAIIALLVLLFLTIGAYYLTNNKKEPAEHLVYDEFDAIYGKINDHTYYIFGAKPNITFEVNKENDFSYELVDSNNNKINSQNSDGNSLVIKAPEGLYKEGMTYHLKIKNGTFKDDKYKEINKIIFSIARSSKQDSLVKEEVLKVSTKDIDVKDNIINLKGSYKENDIIGAYDNDKLMAAYKITKVLDNNKYEYNTPTLKEIFDEIDYYGKERINLSGFENNKDFNLFLNSLIHTVYAKENITINKPIWNKKEQTLEVGISINTSDSKNFLVNHDTKIELTMTLAIDLYRDISLDDYNYAMVINYTTRINDNLNHTDSNFNSLYNDIKNRDTLDNYDTKWLDSNYANITGDKKTIDKSFGSILAETKVPGLYLNLDTGIFIDINTKGYLNNSLTGNNTLLIGVSKNDGIYSDYSFDNKSNFTFVGDNDNKILGTINAKLNFINIFNLNTKLSSGVYTSGKTVVDIDKEDKTQTKISLEINGDSGYLAKYIVNATSANEKTIFDDTESLTKYTKKVTIRSKKEDEKEEDKKEDEKVTYKYSEEEVKELLKSGYDTLDSLEEWNRPLGSFTTHIMQQKVIDVNSNTFTGTWNFDDTISYTCTYNYVSEEMACENFDNAQSYVKDTCDKMYNDYLTFKETGEVENEDAKEWENLYSSIDACYYEAVPKDEPTDFKEDIQSILNQVELTFDDLGVLKTSY